MANALLYKNCVMQSTGAECSLYVGDSLEFTNHYYYGSSSKPYETLFTFSKSPILVILDGTYNTVSGSSGPTVTNTDTVYIAQNGTFAMVCGQYRHVIRVNGTKLEFKTYDGNYGNYATFRFQILYFA